MVLTGMASEDDLPFRHAHPALVQIFLCLPPQHAIALFLDKEKRWGSTRRTVNEQTIPKKVGVACSYRSSTHPYLLPSLPAYLHRHIRLSPGLVGGGCACLDIAFPQEPPHPGQVGTTGFLVLKERKERRKGGVCDCSVLCTLTSVYTRAYPLSLPSLLPSIPAPSPSSSGDRSGSPAGRPGGGRRR